jgi:hypothetical protein
MIIKYEDDGIRGTWCFANRNGRLIIHCPVCGGLLINEYGPRRVEEKSSTSCSGDRLATSRTWRPFRRFG